jgi:putative phosphoesterase
MRGPRRMLASLEVDRVLHCGDIGSAAVVELFAPWPTDFVFGNCDADRRGLAAAIEAAGQTCHGEFGALELAGKRIALIHSDDRRRFQQTIHSGEWDLVCYGHTHVAAIEHFGPTLVRSRPPSLLSEATGPNRAAPPACHFGSRMPAREKLG